MQTKTTGLVLRETRVDESSKLLTLLTAEGKKTAKARGALRKNSRVAPACQLFAFSEFTLYERGGYYTVDEAAPLELFCPLRERVEALALAAYAAEVLDALADADAGTGELLQLGLNTLFALSAETAPDALVKGAFEIRAAAIAGYMPDLGGEDRCACVACGRADGLYLCPEAGGLYCRDHLPSGSASLPTDGGAAEAIRYACRCEPKRLFSFRLEPAGVKRFAEAAERYLAACLGRHFRTLDYYKRF